MGSCKQKNSDGNAELILNGKTILTVASDDVDEAFVYNNLPHHKNKKKVIEKIIISYNSNSCKLDGVDANCTKFKLLDFTNGFIASNSFYPPVLNSNLMDVICGKDDVKFQFEDSSVFEFKAGKLTLACDGVVGKNNKLKPEDYITSN